MQELDHAFERESQRPGKSFHELIRRRHGELGLPVPREERVLPFYMQVSDALHAIDIAIDHVETNSSTVSRTLTQMRAERRLDELEAAIDDATWRKAPPRVIRSLVAAYEQEL